MEIDGPTSLVVFDFVDPPVGHGERALMLHRVAWFACAPSGEGPEHSAFTAYTALQSRVDRRSDSGQLPLIGSMIVLTREMRVAGTPAALA
jgi:hypothetical protein